MYRHILLDFINTNLKQLQENKILAFTVVLPKQTLPMLASLYHKQDEVTIYHIKDQYTFEKKYQLDVLKNTIAFFAFESTNNITLNYSDLDDNFIDPYYLKSIKAKTFQSFAMIPLYQDNQLDGIILLYSDNNTINFNITNNKWQALIDKLYDDLHNTYHQQILKSIFDSEEVYIITKALNKDAYYLNEKCQQDFHFNNNLYNETCKEIPKIQEIIKEMKKITTDEVEIYYLNKASYNAFVSTSELYVKDVINQHHFKEQFAYFFIKDLDQNLSSFALMDKMNKYLSKVFYEHIHKGYLIDDNTIVVIINRQVHKKEENELRFLLKKIYFLVINFPKDLSLGVDLLKLTTYLENNLPTTFNKNAYEKYLFDQNNEKLACDVTFNTVNKILIKADTLATIGNLVMPILPDYDNLASYMIFEKAMINNLEQSLNETITDPIFSVLVKSINRRKVYELLKKVIAKYPLAKIILHAPLIIKEEAVDVFNAILKLKTLGYIIIVDSTIFMNLKYSVCLKLADAVLIRKEETTNSLIEANPFNQLIIKNFYEDGKVVIYEKIYPDDAQDLINELTCLIVDKT